MRSRGWALCGTSASGAEEEAPAVWARPHHGGRSETRCGQVRRRGPPGRESAGPGLGLPAPTAVRPKCVFQPPSLCCFPVGAPLRHQALGMKDFPGPGGPTSSGHSEHCGGSGPSIGEPLKAGRLGWTGWGCCCAGRGEGRAACPRFARPARFLVHRHEPSGTLAAAHASCSGLSGRRHAYSCQNGSSGLFL